MITGMIMSNEPCIQVLTLSNQWCIECKPISSCVWSMINANKQMFILETLSQVSDFILTSAFAFLIISNYRSWQVWHVENVWNWMKNSSRLFVKAQNIKLVNFVDKPHMFIKSIFKKNFTGFLSQ